MSRRIVAYAAVLAALCVAVFAALMWVNSTTKVLNSGEMLDVGLAEEGCALSGWQVGDGGRSYALELDVADDVGDLALVVANVFSFECTYKGVSWRYDSTEPSARLKLIPIPAPVGGHLAIEFDFEQPQTSLRAQVGALETMEAQLDLGKVSYAVCLGMLLLMLVYCITLIVQKPDEVILVYMIALICIVVARDVTQPFALIPQALPTYLKSGLNLALAGGMALLSAEYVFAVYFREHRKTTVVLVAALVAAMALSYLLRGGAFVALYLLMNGVLHLACAACVVVGCARRIPCCGFLLAGLAFAAASFAFYTAADRSLVPAGILVVQGYVIQLYNVPFLLACMLAINSRFVGYYRKLKLVNEHLDSLVEQRAEELRIEEGQKHQLMINVFHDLRTPLFVAGGCVQRLKDDRADDEALDVLENRIDFMTRMTDDLFTIAKLESGDLMLVEDRVDLSSVAQEELASARMLAHEGGVTVEGCVAPGCTVWGDERRIGQVVQNILANAVRHTPAGGSVVLELVEDSEHVRLSVANDGDPIDPQEAKRIFERYYQTQAGGSNGSSGLGLSIARQIMVAHRGDLVLDTDEQGHNRFTAVFPALAQE